MERVLSFEDALAEVLARASVTNAAGAAESLSLLESRGRVLAEAVLAPRDQPPFDRSTRDGYAIRAADVAACTSMRVIGMVQAGDVWSGPAVQSGETVEIMTGAPLPLGADAVLMVEHSKTVESWMSAERGRMLRSGENIVPRGTEARTGDVVLQAGHVMDAAAIAVAASCGCATLKVFAHAKVAIVATGDELVELDGTPDAQQIFNSNSYALSAMVSEAGGEAGKLKIARDTKADLQKRVAQASMWDLVVLTGGVSMGKYDLVEEVLAEFGAEFFFTGAKIQPGKPVVFGRMPKSGVVGGHGSEPWIGEWTYFFGLPGNPVSTQVCFHLFVAPMLRALCGRKDVAPRFVEATVLKEFDGKHGLVRFLPAVVEGDFRGVSVRPVSWQGSGDVAGNARATEYCVVEEQGLHVGDVARVLLR